MSEFFFCDISQMIPEQHARHRFLARRLEAREAMQELSNGYGLRFAFDPDLALELAEFITLEHLCCPFLNLALELEGSSDLIWLKLTGAEGVKDFIVAELGFNKKGA